MPVEDGVRKKPDHQWFLDNFLRNKILKVETVRLFDGGVDSSQMLPVHIEELASEVWNSLKGGKIPLITHGTDSLATTGLILSQLFPDRLIVITGAFRPIGIPHSDAEENIHAAFLVAKTFLDPSVPKVPYATINGKIYLASSLVKLDIENDPRRGFDSYQRAVGVVKGSEIEWDPVFIQTFEKERIQGLEKTSSIREKLIALIEKRMFRLAPVEIAFVNPSTPAGYLHGLLDRLEMKKSSALVIRGYLTNQEFFKRIEGKDLPIFVERFSPYSSKIPLVEIPDTIQPAQVWSKLAVFAGILSNTDQLALLLSENIAGELTNHKTPDDFKSPFVPYDFYQTNITSRGFLIYFQNLPLFKEALVSEIIRLDQQKGSRIQAELVIEALGNGHIYVGGTRNLNLSVPISKKELLNKIKDANCCLDILECAQKLGIQVTIVAAPPDAIPNTDYDVGQILKKSGVQFAKQPEREYLKKAAREMQSFPFRQNRLFSHRFYAH